VKLRKFANGYLQYAPGCEAQLITALTKALLEEGLENKAFTAAKVKELDSFKAALASVSLADAAAAAGVAEADLRSASG